MDLALLVTAKQGDCGFYSTEGQLVLCQRRSVVYKDFVKL